MKKCRGWPEKFTCLSKNRVPLKNIRARIVFPVTGVRMTGAGFAGIGQIRNQKTREPAGSIRQGKREVLFVLGTCHKKAGPGVNLWPGLWYRNLVINR